MTQLTTQGLRDLTQPASALQVIQWAAATGSVNAIEAAYEDPVLTLQDGLALCFRASGANTSTTPTFSPDGLTAYPITKRGGLALEAGDIPRANAEIIVRFNSANLRWELLAFDNPDIPWAAAAGTADAITAAYPVTVAAVVDGLLLSFRASGPNTVTTPTFSPDGLTARTIVKDGGIALAAGDIPGAGAEMLVRYRASATRWELLNPSPASAVTNNNTSLNLVQDLWKVLAADDTGGQNVNTAQPWLPTAGGVTVVSDKLYAFEGQLFLTRSAGANSHTTGVLFAGTATLTSIEYLAQCKEGDANDLQDISGFWSTAATTLVVKAASTSTTENIIIRVRGHVRINVGGTFIPQFIYSAAPGGAPTIKRGSYFHMHPLGAGAATAQGTWA